MRAALAVLAAALLGCGGAIECQLLGLAVRLETGALCEDAAVSVRLARVMLSNVGAVPVVEFERAFAGLAVRVVQADRVGGYAGGAYWPATPGVPDRIDLTRHGWSLLHELIHAREVRTGVASAVDPHAGWDAKGYTAASRAFVNDAPSLDR